jgi:hypothetical protein
MSVPAFDPPPEGEAGRVEEVAFAGRYRATRLLKRGNGVATFLGVDHQTGETVVIKSVEGQRLPPGVRTRLEHEALVLGQLRSTSVAPLLAVGTEGAFYLVMGYVPGLSLEERLRSGALSVRDTLALGLHLFAALKEVHDQGVLHRDLKPAHIIVTDPGPGPVLCDLERATLIDFGVSRSDLLDWALRDQPVGTARYLAPEQAGLLDQKPDNRADLYSAGVVLFECLAGRPPFEADTVGELLRQHLTVRPPSLRGIRAVPRVLEEVIQRLLRKDPRDRYQSAEGALADLMRIALALSRGEAEPALVVGLHDRRRTLTEPAFVGRDAELAALEAQLGRARDGHGGLVLLEAPSGGGKTRLLGELRERARSGAFRFWCLQGHGLDQAAQRPFQILSGVAAGLLEEERSRARLSGRLREGLGERASAVCAALPELREALACVGAEESGPETFGHLRVQQALAALLDALGAQTALPWCCWTTASGPTN